MHILFVCAWWPDIEDPSHGIFIQEQAEAIGQKVKVSVIYPRMLREKHIPYRIHIKEQEHAHYTFYEVNVNMLTQRFGYFDWVLSKALNQCVAAIQAHQRIDLCHIHVLNRLTKNVLTVKLLDDVPFILTEHQSFYHTEVHHLPLRLKKHQVSWRSKALNNKKIKTILPVSQHLQAALVKDFQVHKNKVHILANMVHPLFQYKQKAISEKCIIALVAQWGKSKQPMLFAKALAKLDQKALKQIEVHWVGGGPLLDEVRNYLLDKQLSCDITFHGYQNKEYIANLLQRASFLVHPTRWENLPCIIIESLCCGTPVLSMNIEGVRDLVHDRNGLLCEPDNVDALYVALKKMLNQYSKFDHRFIAEQTQQLYSQDFIVGKLFKIYDDVLSTT